MMRAVAKFAMVEKTLMCTSLFINWFNNVKFSVNFRILLTSNVCTRLMLDNHAYFSTVKYNTNKQHTKCNR